ncbi:MAG: NUDIX hydrolase [Saccharofermentanales bacterium]
MDIFYRNKDYIFSYRVAGILVRNGKVLLHRPLDDDGYAFPGGHVALGETNEQTLVREFREEIGAEIRVNGLRWVGEIFFLLEGTPCHQICIYYDVSLADDSQVPADTNFFVRDTVGDVRIELEFSWIGMERLKDIRMYPAATKELMLHYSSEVRHFVADELDRKD